MDVGLELVRQNVVDGAVLRHAAQPNERRCGDADAEMRLPFGPRSSVPLMSCRLVDHFKMGRSKFGGKFCNNRVANRHKCNPLEGRFVFDAKLGTMKLDSKLFYSI